MPKPTTLLPKAATGIQGLDEILKGGLPKGRPTLICGSAGCGKTLLAMEFLVRGAKQFDEPGVFMAFEEAEGDLIQNVASLGFDVPGLIVDKKMLIDFVRIDREEIHETGEYDLEGLFIRLDYAINTIGAKRVVLDTVESIFSGFSNSLILRNELRRLFRWLKEKGVTAVITGERGDGALTRHGLEEYVSDCVIVLDHRIVEQVSTRRLWVAKYRGSIHGTNEYPFLIDEEGISVVPITSLGLEHPAFAERISTGIPQLDDMLGGKGYYRGSTILVTGAAGSGKSSMAAYFACLAGSYKERALYFAFEESTAQILRNMGSIGIDLQPLVEKGHLQFNAMRPSVYGLEMHLTMMHKKINEFNPAIVIVDPISALINAGNEILVKMMLTRLVDFLKVKGITTLFTSLTTSNFPLGQTNTAISTLMDTWVLLRNVEVSGERRRSLSILKSRGMAHSNKVCRFFMTDQGIRLEET